MSHPSVRRGAEFMERRLGCVDGERTCGTWWSRIVSLMTVLTTRDLSPREGQTTHLQPRTTIMYTPCLSTNGSQHPSDPGIFQAESGLLFVVSVRTRL